MEQIWVWGAGVGMVLAWMAGRALKTKLYGVGSADAGALAFAPALLLARQPAENAAEKLITASRDCNYARESVA